MACLLPQSTDSSFIHVTEQSFGTLSFPFVEGVSGGKESTAATIVRMLHHPHSPYQHVFLLYFATGENGGTALLGVSWQQCPFREREMAGLEQYCHLGGGAVWTKHVRRSWGGGGCSGRRPFEIKKTSESADEQKESQRHSFQLSEGGLLCPCFHRMSRCTGQSMGVVGQGGGLSLFRTL